MLRNRLILWAALSGAVLGCSDTITGGGVESPASGDILALASDGDLFWVDPADPDSIQGDTPWPSGSQVMVTVGYRPVTGVLYGRGVDGGLYVIDPARGQPTAFGTPVAVPGATTFASSFSSLIDRWRIVTAEQHNARYHPVNAGLTFDAPLNTTATIGAIAYTTPVGGVQTLYAIDNTNKQLVRIGGLDGDPSPDLGAIQVVGDLGLGTPVVTARGMAITAGGVAYAAIRLDSDNLTKLYTINLGTGAATLVGQLGTGEDLRGIALVP